ncbi:N-acetylmuramoyl-L-alanine amidase [Brevibacillus sp. VP]|uniref:N-acetylmuramoyl-L-alanine amidase n=1 Tax=Brevibacillus sp. JB24b TaxID=3422308 RepID=UPI0022874DF3
MDPGHGGKDPGSIGSDGTDEADLNLKIAKNLFYIFPCANQGRKPSKKRSVAGIKYEPK